ncbi:hypothetical protein EI94DRAFT_1702626 [Lactarius quietus]|nr:hypothetical protein EI94DRAFT_1702626 [Lactarius quietus]
MAIHGINLPWKQETRRPPRQSQHGINEDIEGNNDDGHQGGFEPWGSSHSLMVQEGLNPKPDLPKPEPMVQILFLALKKEKEHRLFETGAEEEERWWHRRRR